MLNVQLQQISQFLDTQGFLDYLERGLGSEGNGNNLLDKLQDAIGRGQNPSSILPSVSAEPDIVTISDPGLGIPGNLNNHLNWTVLDMWCIATALCFFIFYRIR